MDEFVKLKEILQKEYGIVFDSFESLILEYRKKYSEDKKGIFLIEAYNSCIYENKKDWERRERYETLVSYLINKKGLDNIQAF